MIIILLIIVLVAIVWLPIPVGLGCFFGMIGSNKRPVLYYLLFCVGVSLLTLWIVPAYDSDLSRYYDTMRLMQPLSDWSAFIDFSKNNRILQYQDANKVFNVIEFFVAKTGQFSWLPFISTLVCNLLVLFPVVDLRKQKKLNSWLAGGLSIELLLLFNLNLTANTMRWAMAVALFGCMSYVYFVKMTNFKFIWLLITPIFFHLGIILAVILALFVAIFREKKRLSYPVLILGFIGFWLFADRFVGPGSAGMFAQITNMATIYSTDFMVRNSNGLIVLFLSRFSGLLLVIAAVVVGSESKSEKCDNFGRLCRLQFVFWLLLFNNSMIFNRYVLVSAMLSLFYIGKNMNCIKKSMRSTSLLLIGISGLMLLVITYAGFRRMTFAVPLLELVTKNLISLFRNMPIF